MHAAYRARTGTTQTPTHTAPGHNLITRTAAREAHVGTNGVANPKQSRFATCNGRFVCSGVQRAPGASLRPCVFGIMHRALRNATCDGLFATELQRNSNVASKPVGVSGHTAPDRTLAVARVGCSGVRKDMWAVNYTNFRWVHLGEAIYPPHDMMEDYSVTVFGQIPWDTGMQLVHNYNEWLHLNFQLLQMRQNRTIFYRVRFLLSLQRQHGSC